MKRIYLSETKSICTAAAVHQKLTQHVNQLFFNLEKQKKSSGSGQMGPEQNTDGAEDCPNSCI